MFFCAAESRRRDEPLFGTASRGLAWALLEVPRSWRYDALDRCGLPEPVVAHLRAFAGRGGCRVVFLRRGFAPVERPSLFLAVVRRDEPFLKGWTLDAYDDLLAVDLGAEERDPERSPESRSTGPLFLVCTHGRHDPCCARWGLSLYRELCKRAPAASWQASHVGGDRFAANLLWLPWGVFYGRLVAGDLDRLLAAADRDEVLLDRFRGRGCYPFPVQAAEYFVRRDSGEMSAVGPRYLGARREGEGRWTMGFAARGAVWTARIERCRSAERVRSTCKAEGTSSVPEYRLVGMERREEAGG